MFILSGSWQVETGCLEKQFQRQTGIDTRVLLQGC